ncbi:hypothetical protein Ahy_A03g015716 [Arachis hypogaea]|uniref:Uncharacterized protein n=1 Tax=Arachis hypogaea TaxID=3818 RepID=A0A445E124_ARAHY|nr:hypothetical protein Ahy_A03g015716 [Arachis hypogaea]
MVHEQAAKFPGSDAPLRPVRRGRWRQPRPREENGAAARFGRDGSLGCSSGRRRSAQGLGCSDGGMCNGNRAKDLRPGRKDAREEGSSFEVAGFGAHGSVSSGVCAANGRGFAAVCWGLGMEVKLEEIQVDPPKSGKVRVKMLCASICHTNVSGIQGSPYVNGFGVDYSFECTGVASLISESLAATNMGTGKAITIGAPNEPIVPFNHTAILAGRTLKGSVFGGLKAMSDPEYIDEKVSQLFNLDSTSLGMKVGSNFEAAWLAENDDALRITGKRKPIFLIAGYTHGAVLEVVKSECPHLLK